MEEERLEEPAYMRWVDLGIWVAVLVLAFNRFLHLGYGDLKDWDECLYAWRAKLICELDVWRDQSDFAWDGFYSAAFPPLQVWFTAVMFKLLGYTEFAARTYSALCGAGSVIAIFVLGRRMTRDRWTGLFAALFLGSIWYYTVFSRRSQFDVPYTFFIIASIYGYVAYVDNLRFAGRRHLTGNRRAWLWLVFSGLALGLGLMTKIALALMAPIVVGGVSFYAWLRGRHSFGRMVVEQLIINGVALIVILPWHLAMTLSTEGRDFWHWYIGYHLLSRSQDVLDAHAGRWYVYFPMFYRELTAPITALVVVAFPWLAYQVVRSFWSQSDLVGGGRWSEGNTDRPWAWRDTRYLIPLIWLGFQLLLFCSSATKREPYMLPMFPPIALMAAFLLGELLRDKRRMVLLAFAFFSMLTFGTLSRMKTFGDQLEDALVNWAQVELYPDVFAKLGLLVVGMAAGTAVVYYLVVVILRRPQTFRLLALLLLVGASTVFSLRKTRRILDPDKGTRRFGWQEIRTHIDPMDYHYLVFAGSYWHPAANYYLNGLHLHWHPYLAFAPMPDYDLARILQYTSTTEARVVVMKSWVDENWTRDQLRTLLERLELLDEGNDLAVYRVKPPDRAGDRSPVQP
jgi:4-amino-4-deoxy-L-arabinose transferase-like glycosyltransferase